MEFFSGHREVLIDTSCTDITPIALKLMLRAAVTLQLHSNIKITGGKMSPENIGD